MRTFVFSEHLLLTYHCAGALTALALLLISIALARCHTCAVASLQGVAVSTRMKMV
jgi:hypothetical protein